MAVARAAERGSSVLEALVSALLASLVLGAAIGLLHAHATLARRLQSSLAALGSSAWAIDVASRDVALAGADPLRSGVEALRSADPERVEVDADLDGDGVVDPGSAERVALSRSAGAGGRLLRRVGAQPMAMAAPVGAGGFRLRYFDAAGQEIAPGAALDAGERARVRRVDLELAVDESPAHGTAVRLPGAAALRARAGRP